jgi:outer membrane protein
MKNGSLYLNIFLLVAVGVLYYLHFSGKQVTPGTPETAGRPLPSLPVSAGGIVYINSDSMLEQFEFFKTKRKEFESYQTRVKNELKQQGEKLQQEIEEYQQQAVGMTDSQRQQKEEQLSMKQQQYLQRRDDALAKLEEQQDKSSEELYDKLGVFLKEFNAGKNYQFILGYQRGGGILLANDSLNITRQVISGLNEKYKSE